MPLLAFQQENGTKRLRVILPRKCRLLKPADYCHSNKYPLWVSAIEEIARSLRADVRRVNDAGACAGGISGFFRKGSGLKICGVLFGPFASKPAPTFVLRTQVHCGSGLAREGGLTAATNLNWQWPATSPSPNGCAHG